MKTLNIPTSVSEITALLPSLDADQQQRLDTTKGHVASITKHGRKRMGKGFIKLGKLIRGTKS